MYAAGSLEFPHAVLINIFFLFTWSNVRALVRNREPVGASRSFCACVPERRRWDCTVISEPLHDPVDSSDHGVCALSWHMQTRHLATRIVCESIVTGPVDSFALTLICGESLPVRTISHLFWLWWPFSLFNDFFPPLDIVISATIQSPDKSGY